MGCPDWHTAMQLSAAKTSVDILSAEFSGNEQAARLASTTDITSDLQFGRTEVFRGLRNFLNMDRPEHIDRRKERGMEKGSGRHSTLQGRERSVINLTNIGTVSGATLGRLLRDGRSAYGPFSVLRCHLELKLKLKLQTAQFEKCSTFVKFF